MSRCFRDGFAERAGQSPGSRAASGRWTRWGSSSFPGASRAEPAPSSTRPRETASGRPTSGLTDNKMELF